MTAKEKLLKRLPKKYHERVRDFYAEGGLIDDCKYVLEFGNGWVWSDGYLAVPIVSIKEAIEFTKETHKVDNNG